MYETIGYKAQKEIDSIIYNDKDFFKPKQFSKSNVITLKSVYEEILIYWDEEIRFRPNFSVSQDIVQIPTFFSLIYGMDNNQYEFFRNIKKLNTQNAYFILKDNNGRLITKHNKGFKILDIKVLSKLLSICDFFKTDKLDVKRVKNSQFYKYGLIDTYLQDNLFEKIQYIIDNNIINIESKTKINNIILACALKLPDKIISFYKEFDFTSKNPKLLYLSNITSVLSIEEIISIVLCHYLGFDVVIYSLNGFNILGDYIDIELINEHNIGDTTRIIEIPNIYLNEEE